MILISIRLLYSLLIYLLSTTIWLSYIIIMIFLRGIIIIFFYIASLRSNQSIQIQKKYIFFVFVLINILSLIFWFLDLYVYNDNFSINRLFFFFFEFRSDLVYKCYRFINYEIRFFLTIYLLLVLLIVVEITSINKNSLRIKKLYKKK